MSEVQTPFKDKTMPKASFEIKPTLGTTPGQPEGQGVAGVTGKVSPKELPGSPDSLLHGFKSKR